MEDKRLKIFRQKTNRNNLVYEVCPKPDTKVSAMNLLTNIVKKRFNGDSGLIYTANIKQCNDVFTHLRKNGISCLPYHSDINIDIRKKTQSKWSKDKCQVIICTEAFGLGINKVDVYFVIHFTTPPFIENYYQESGRAGRDGERSHCILLYQASDFAMEVVPKIADQGQETLVKMKSMIQYAQNETECRRKILSKLLGEEDVKCNICDICTRSQNDDIEEQDITNQSLLIMQMLDLSLANKYKLSFRQINMVMRGTAKHYELVKIKNKLSISESIAHKYTLKELVYILFQLVADGYIKLDIRNDYQYHNVVCAFLNEKKAKTFLRKENKPGMIMINIPRLSRNKRKHRKEKKEDTEDDEDPKNQSVQKRKKQYTVKERKKQYTGKKRICIDTYDDDDLSEVIAHFVRADKEKADKEKANKKRKLMNDNETSNNGPIFSLKDELDQDEIPPRKDNIDNSVPEDFNEDSLSYKAFIDLSIWNGGKGKNRLGRAKIMKLAQSTGYIIEYGGGGMAVENIIGVHAWRRFGNELFLEIARIHKEWKQNKGVTQIKSKTDYRQHSMNNYQTMANPIIINHHHHYGPHIFHSNRDENNNNHNQLQMIDPEERMSTPTQISVKKPKPIQLPAKMKRKGRIPASVKSFQPASCLSPDNTSFNAKRAGSSVAGRVRKRKIRAAKDSIIKPRYNQIIISDDDSDSEDDEEYGDGEEDDSDFIDSKDDMSSNGDGDFDYPSGTSDDQSLDVGDGFER